MFVRCVMWLRRVEAPIPRRGLLNAPAIPAPRLAPWLDLQDLTNGGPLPVEVVAHTDERLEFGSQWAGGFAVENATRGWGPLSRCWCTSTGHDRNVGVLVELACPTLITGVGVLNPAEGFDCPVGLCLAFAHAEAPGGLEGATRHAAAFADGGRDEQSKAVVARLVAAPHDEGGGPPWGAWATTTSEPLVAIQFPAPPACDGMHIVQRCKPTAARYVHFLIVSAYNPNGHEGANVDVSKLQLFGLPLGAEGCAPET